MSLNEDDPYIAGYMEVMKAFQSFLIPGRKDVQESYSPARFMIETTRTCTAKCAHCILSAGPDRREKLTIDQIRAGIQDAALNDFETAELYGGEPMVDENMVYETVREAYKNDLMPHMGTNCFWGKSPERVKRFFDAIEGIQKDFQNPLPFTIQASTDEYHEQFVQLESIANIIIEWVKRAPENIHMQLNMTSNPNETEYKVLDRLLDITERLSDLIPTNIRRSIEGEMFIAFGDKQIEVPQSLTKDQLIQVLREEQMIEERALKSLEECKSTREIYETIDVNNYARLICSEQNTENKTYTIGRYKNKKLTISIHGTTISGRAEETITDPETRRLIAEEKKGHNQEMSSGVNEKVLILGSDNKFYIHPAQLAYGISPLGENTGDAIGTVIDRVNEGDPAAKALIKSQDAVILSIALRLSSPETISKIEELITEDLSYEAVVEGLKHQEIVEELNKCPREY